MRSNSLRGVAGLALLGGLVAGTGITADTAAARTKKTRRARLEAPADGVTKRARGTVRLRRKRSGDSLRIKVKRLEAATVYRVLCDDPSSPFDPSAHEFATATTNRRGVLALVLGGAERPLPHGADAEDLQGVRLEIRDAQGDIAVEGQVPGPAKALPVSPGCVLRDEQVMADGFDLESTGQQPLNWTVTGTADPDPTVLVDGTVQDGTSGNSVAFADTSATAAGAMARRFRTQSGLMAVEFTLISSAQDGELTMAVAEGASALPGFGDGLGFYADGTIGFATGSGIQDYEPDTAYALRVEIDLVGGFFDVLIDGVRVVEDRDLGATAASADTVRFATGAAATGSANLDSVRVFEVGQDCPPTAEAGEPQTVECTGSRTAVQLDGTGSSDPEDADLIYAWTGPFVERTATGARPTVHFATNGPHDVELTVSDGFHRSEADVVTITVEDTTPPIVTAPPDLQVECSDPRGDQVRLGTPEVADLCDPEPVVTNDAPDRFGLGVTVVTWTATDASGNSATAEQTVTVVDTTPPRIAINGLATTLWPPNHKMVDIGGRIVVEDACDAQPTLTVEVTSSEPDNGQGDGNTTGDIAIHSPRDIDLRAERSGNGPGRTYTLVWTATDASDNSTTVTRTVVVPHSKNGK